MNRVLSAALALLIISGCASGYKIQNTQIDADTPLPAGHGIAVVKIINNAARISTLHYDWTSIVVVRVDNLQANLNATDGEGQPDIYSLKQVSKWGVNRQLFIGSMPAGQYRILNLHSFFHNGDISASLTAPVSPILGSFEIRAAQVSNLGNLVFQPFNAVTFDPTRQYRTKLEAYVTRLSAAEDLSKAVRWTYPNIASGLDKSRFNPWLPDDFGAYRDELTQLSRKNAFGTRAIAMNGSYVGAIVARFGQIRALKDDGKWQTMNLPTDSDITTVMGIENNLLAASVDGQVFLGDEEGAAWQALNPVPRGEVVTWLAQGANGYYAFTRSDKGYQVYQFDSIFSPWNRFSSPIPKPEAGGLFSSNGGTFVWLDARGLPTVLRDETRFQFDPAGNRWVTSNYDKRGRIQQLPNGVLMGLEHSSWSGTNGQVLSYDAGDNWEEVRRSLHFSKDRDIRDDLPVILDDGTIVTLGRIVNEGAEKGRSLRVLTNQRESMSEVKTWTSHGRVRTGCKTQLSQLTLGNRLYFLCDGGDVFSTGDFGLSWQNEFDVDLDEIRARVELMEKAAPTPKI